MPLERGIYRGKRNVWLVIQGSPSRVRLDRNVDFHEGMGIEARDRRLRGQERRCQNKDEE